MNAFTYIRDRLFIVAVAMFTLNEFVLKSAFSPPILHYHFNDFWLIPCALPLLLCIHRKLGLREHDLPPTFAEIIGHLIVWSLLFEGIGPHWLPHATGDWRDVIAYCSGGFLAGVWWNRASLFRPQMTT